MPRPHAPTLTLLAAAAAAVLLTGCYDGTARDREIRSDPSPELDTLYQRPDDVDNALTVTFDENLRMAKQDLGRFWLVDRPSRLTRETVPRP